MPVPGVEFRVLDGLFTIVKLPPGSPVPPVPAGATFWSATVTEEEVSLVCSEADVPENPDIYLERTWRCLKVAGPLEFELKGILASLLNPLADASISVFAISTYHTDYIFVKEFVLEKAVEALVGAGHRLV